MKINNKGFAISSIMYMILVLAIVLIISTLSIISGKDAILNKLSSEATLDILDDEPNSDVVLVDYIKNLYSQTKTVTSNSITYSYDDVNGLMYDRLGGTTDSLIDGNLRYYGAGPNNYIDIGDRETNDNIIFWRIIGVFKDVIVVNDDGTTITQDLVKIIRANNLTTQTIGGFSWDYTESGSYDNNWADATLMTMLNSNEGYYGAGSSYNYYNDSLTAQILDLSDIGISSDLKNKIAKVKWNIGKQSSYSINIHDIYNYEKENLFEANIGLINLSDYGYAADLSQCFSQLGSYNTTGCYDTDWISNNSYQWTLNASSSNSTTVYYVYSTGRIGSSGGANGSRSVRPVMYLKADVKISKSQKTKDGITYYEVS